MRVKVGVVIGAAPRRVWDVVSDIATHAEWMEDAVAIRFTSRKRAGVGTTFVCDTKVGPFRTEDRMEVTQWRDRKAMGVRHTGLVSGEGVFRLHRRGRNRTYFTWEERLAFPAHLGGPVTAFLARPVLRAFWRRNLRNLKDLVEMSGP